MVVVETVVVGGVVDWNTEVKKNEEEKRMGVVDCDAEETKDEQKGKEKKKEFGGKPKEKRRRAGAAAPKGSRGKEGPWGGGSRGGGLSCSCAWTNGTWRRSGTWSPFLSPSCVLSLSTPSSPCWSQEWVSSCERRRKWGRKRRGEGRRRRGGGETEGVLPAARSHRVRGAWDGRRDGGRRGEGGREEGRERGERGSAREWKRKEVLLLLLLLLLLQEMACRLTRRKREMRMGMERTKGREE